MTTRQLRIADQLDALFYAHDPNSKVKKDALNLARAWDDAMLAKIKELQDRVLDLENQGQIKLDPPTPPQCDCGSCYACRDKRPHRTYEDDPDDNRGNRYVPGREFLD